MLKAGAAVSPDVTPQVLTSWMRGGAGLKKIIQGAVTEASSRHYWEIYVVLERATIKVTCGQRMVAKTAQSD